jgi:hypothetical protein
MVHAKLCKTVLGMSLNKAEQLTCSDIGEDAMSIVSYFAVFDPAAVSAC